MEPVHPADMRAVPWTAGAWMVVVLLLALTVCLVAYMRRFRGTERCDACWLPRITAATWDREEYRCRDCGTRYGIQTDLSLPRGRHRWWAAR